MLSDEDYMRLALAEGAKGIGLTSPNPPVGAIVVRDDHILGRGWHQRAGEAHAERRALADVVEQHGPDAAKGATLYVTLEPCSTYGRTPPCTDAILESGITRVVISATDPNPRHLGRGLDLLRNAGVEVCIGILEKEGRDLIRFFTKHVVTGLPWVIAKTAITLDGRTTLPMGLGQWISSEVSREDVQFWRHQCDAILVGGETFRKDNPALTLRDKWAEDRPQPWRVVLSSDSNLSQNYADHRLFQDTYRDHTLIHCGITLKESLADLGQCGIASVLLESGGRLLTHALETHQVDELILYLAPILGGADTHLITSAQIVARLDDIEYTPLGPDLRIRARVRKE